MAYARRSNSFGGGSKGGNKFGGAPRGRGFSDRGGERSEMYPATCADCGKRCEVPFRPNGSKPVLCQSCFGQGNSFEPKFNKRSEGSRFEGSRSTGNDGTAEQLRAINAKLDTIIKSLKTNHIEL